MPVDVYEIVINLHIHTSYSDGYGSHSHIAAAALRAGLDAVIVTDHNVLVSGMEKIYKDGDRRLLMLIGEEIHDQARQPQKSHLLVIGTNRELATLAYDQQRLMDGVRQAGGLSFIAHPVDPAAPAVGEPDISWEDWQVQGFTGIELWNGLSEFKSRLKTRLHAIFYALNPYLVAQGPFPEVLRRWDDLLRDGQKVVAVGGSDAHALPGRLGILRRTLFPYEFHFKAINTHLFIPTPLTGDPGTDRRLVLDALGQGRGFVGYDLPMSTRGFRFTAKGRDRTAWMGDEVSAQGGVTLQIRLPLPSECRLIRNGKVIKTWFTRETCTHITNEPGVYRVEVYVNYLGRKRGWIFSNPIYIKGESMKLKHRLLLCFALALLLTAPMCTVVAPPTNQSAAQPGADEIAPTLDAEDLATLTADHADNTDTAQGVGSLSGQLTYPSEGIPALRVVAINLDTGEYFFVETTSSQNSYQLQKLPAGTYNVLAFTEKGVAGGYTQAVLCGLSAECTDHTLIDVTVKAGQDTPDINPQDWYAPEGAFPADPSR